MNFLKGYFPRMVIFFQFFQGLGHLKPQTWSCKVFLSTFLKIFFQDFRVLYRRYKCDFRKKYFSNWNSGLIKIYFLENFFQGIFNGLLNIVF